VPDQPADELALLDRHRRVARYYLKGRPQTWIARKLGVSQPTVSRDLEAVRKRWLAEMVKNLDAVKVRELARIDEIEVSYWRAWERSIGKHTRTTETLSGDEIEVSETTETLVGDPRFLAGVMACVERRCRIFGLDAPKRLDAKVSVPVKVVAGINMDAI